MYFHKARKKRLFGGNPKKCFTKVPPPQEQKNVPEKWWVFEAETKKRGNKCPDFAQAARGPDFATLKKGQNFARAARGRTDAILKRGPEFCPGRARADCRHPEKRLNSARVARGRTARN